MIAPDRSRLPLPGHPRPFAFPSVHRSTLPNGLGVWVVRHVTMPIVTCILLIRSGSAADPPAQEGLAALTADLLDEGSGDRSAIDLHEALARLGAQFDIDIGSDAMGVSITTLNRFVAPALALVADMTVRPNLAEPDFARVRQLRLHRLAQLRDVPSAVADRAFVRLLYGDQPYGHPPIGTEPALAALTVDDVRQFHRRAIAPDASTLIAVGDCDPDEIHRIAADLFAGWTADPPPAAELDAPPPAAARVNVISRPGAPQSELRIGHVAAARHIPDYHALVAGNMVLGGQFVSRINLNLRETRGLTYGAHTAFDFRRQPGPFVLHVSVDSAATGEAVLESLREITDARGPRPITAQELALGIAALTRGYPRNFETGDQIARGVVQMALYDLPDDYFAEYVPRMEAVTPAEATAALARYIDPLRLITLAVGDLDRVVPDLERAGLGAPVVVPND